MSRRSLLGGLTAAGLLAAVGLNAASAAYAALVLKYQIPPGNPTVVWDNDEGRQPLTHDPYVSWQYHLDRTGRGGVDMTASAGTLLYAPINCYVYRWYDGAGTAVELRAADGSGWSEIFDHLTSVDVPDGTLVQFGGRVATSGSTGAAGAHLHWHRLDPSGIRRIPWDYFTEGSISPDPASDDQGEEMRLFKVTNLAGTVSYYAVGNGHWTTLPSSEVYSTLRDAGEFPEVSGLNSTQWGRIWRSLAMLGYTESNIAYPS